MNVMIPELPYFSRIGDDGEAADRAPVHDVVERGRVGHLALALQQAVVIAVYGVRVPCFAW